MSSPYRPRSRSWGVAALLVAALALALTACGKKNEAKNASLPLQQTGPQAVAVTTLFPGGGSPPPEDPRGKLYERDAHAIADGQRLFNWYNCSGCHFHGGGGIGPALMDKEWIYGGHMDQIYASIYQGRPNGMPSWAEKIPEAEIWEIAAYVHSLSLPSAAQSAPGETMPTSPPAPVPEPEKPKSDTP